MAGFIRLVWFTTFYSQAKIGLFHEYRENERLVIKLNFMDNILLKETRKLNDLVDYEDITRLAYGMHSISADVRKAGIGGAPPAEEITGRADYDPLILKAGSVQENLSILLHRAQLQNTTFEQMNEFVGGYYTKWAQSPSIRPASGMVTSGFGLRPDPMTGITLFHDGLDIANEIGTPVFAPADGIVKETGQLQDYGNVVILKHPEGGVETLYGHLLRSTVSPSEQVKRGELIGFVGNSGKSTGPHLHYEVRKEGHPTNPVPYILPSDQVVD